MSPLVLAVAALATWRMSSLLVAEDGPGRIFARLRERVGVGERETFLAGLLGCVWCVSVWVGAGAALIAFTSAWPVLLPFALSGAAILIECLVAGR